MSVSGYDPSIFVVQPPDKFNCPLCLNVLKDPCQCSSGHSFCLPCLESLLCEKGICPLCRESLSMSKLSKSLIVKEIILEMVTYCPSRDICNKSEILITCCNWTGELHKRDWHYKNECKHRLIRCPNKCGKLVKKLNIDQHISFQCDKANKKVIHDLHLPHVEVKLSRKHKNNLKKVNRTSQKLMPVVNKSIRHYLQCTTTTKIMIFLGLIIAFICTIYIHHLSKMSTLCVSENAARVTDYAKSAIGFKFNVDQKLLDADLLWSNEQYYIVSELLKVEKVLLKRRAFIEDSTPQLILHWFTNYFQIDSMELVIQSLNESSQVTFKDYQRCVYFAVELTWSEVDTISNSVMFHTVDNVEKSLIQLWKDDNNNHYSVLPYQTANFAYRYVIYSPYVDVQSYVSIVLPGGDYTGTAEGASHYEKLMSKHSHPKSELEKYLVDDKLRILVTFLTYVV